RWSPLALLRAHAPSAEVENDVKPQTLEFVVPTENPVSGAKAKSRVFLRLALFGPEKDKKEELRLPEFPVRAPQPESRPGTLAAREEASGGP
ncbi:MAG TPA: hypothetical protein VMM92_14555, partial [Thermoanaerobaculia bacterium]|nr:hypothetical protein [Thermoanaerobaculia bacterium]